MFHEPPFGLESSADPHQDLPDAVLSHRRRTAACFPGSARHGRRGLPIHALAARPAKRDGAMTSVSSRTRELAERASSGTR